LPTVVARYARHTARLEEALSVIAFALGGAAGRRAARQLKLLASASTLLRRIRRTTPVEQPTPRVLDVDDWARRKGQAYGMILVDLERRRVGCACEFSTPDNLGVAPAMMKHACEASLLHQM
jgi:predicted metal-binding protein